MACLPVLFLPWRVTLSVISYQLLPCSSQGIEPGESVGVYLLLTLLMKAFFAASFADVHAHVLLDI